MGGMHTDGTFFVNLVITTFNCPFSFTFRCLLLNPLTIPSKFELLGCDVCLIVRFLLDENYTRKNAA